MGDRDNQTTRQRDPDFRFQRSAVSYLHSSAVSIFAVNTNIERRTSREARNIRKPSKTIRARRSNAHCVPTLRARQSYGLEGGQRFFCRPAPTGTLRAGQFATCFL